MKYFLYTRKSTDEKDRQLQSLESQHDEAIKRFGSLEIIVLPPESISAFEAGRRPVFADMLKRIDKGEAQGIIAWHPDRLSRNPLDGAEIIHRLDTKKLLDLKFCSFAFDNSPEGKMFLSLALSQSKYFSDKLSKDVMRGLGDKAKYGWRPGRAPLGYLNSKTNIKGEQTIVVDQERFPLLRNIFDRMLTGNYTVPRLLETAKNLGLTARGIHGAQRLHLAELYRILGNPFYYGKFEYPVNSGNWYDGKHEPLITLQEFNRVQELLGRKSSARPKSHLFAFTGGLITCGYCGCSITAEKKIKKQKNGNVHEYIYYRCTKKKGECSEGALELGEFDKIVDSMLERLEVPEEFKNWAIRHVEKYRGIDQKTQITSVEQRQKQLTVLGEKVLALNAAFTAPENANQENISQDEFRSLKANLNKQRNDLEASLARDLAKPYKANELTANAFNFASYARYWYKNGNDEIRRAILSGLGSNLTLSSKRLMIPFQKPVAIVMSRLSELDELLAQLELPKDFLSAEEYEALSEPVPILSGLVNDVSTYWRGKEERFFIPKLSLEAAVITE